MKFILILWLYSGHIETVQFDDELACETALAAVKKESRGSGSFTNVIRGVCVRSASQ